MKKFLSLVLALVMTMSLVTISAGAKDFTDADKTTYVEAVDVMSAVKVIDGYADGSFNPTATLTRGAAAKIICNLILGPTTASALKADAAPYSDVPANSTFAGYIAFCAKEGIISGYADGTFRPGNTLTGYAFMKMLLGALGYDKAVEGYEGANWSINVAKRALNIGLDDGLVDSFDGTKAVTREQACLYALNTLKADMVEYDAKTSVSIGGAEVVIAGSKAQPVTTTSKSATIKDEKTATNAVYTVQFGEKYFSDLTLKGERDDFGRPANTWKMKKELIGTFSKTADETFTKKVKKSDVYEVVGKSVYDDLKDGESTLTVYFDGKETVVAKADIDEYIEKNNSGKVNKTGNGDLTEIFIDSANNVTIVTVRTYLFQVVGDYDTKKETLTLGIPDTANADTAVTDITLTDKVLDVDDFPGIEAFKDEEYVLVTAATEDGKKYDVKSIALAEIVEGTVDGYKYADNVEIDGKEYSYNAGTKDEGFKANTGYTVGQKAAVILDAYGYVIGVKEAVVLSDYVFIEAFGSTSSLNTKAIANAVFTDGTREEIVVKKVIDVTDKAAIAKMAGGFWYTFSKNSSGEYTLYPVEKKYTQADAEYAADSKVSYNNKVDFLANDKNGDPQNYLANDDTLFIVSDKDDKLTVYTGVKNAPEVSTLAGSAKVSLLHKTNGYAALVYIDLTGTATISGEQSANLVYVTKYNGKHVTTNNDVYYTYKVLVDGEEEVVKADNKINNLDSDIYTVVNYVTKNSDDVLTGFEVAKTNGGVVVADKGIKTEDKPIVYSAGTLSIGGQKYVVTEDAAIDLIVLKSANELNKDEDASYEVAANISAKELYDTLKNYNVKYDFALKTTEAGKKVLTELYVTVTDVITPAEQVTVSIKASDGTEFTSIKVDKGDKTFEIEVPEGKKLTAVKGGTASAETGTVTVTMDAAITADTVVEITLEVIPGETYALTLTGALAADTIKVYNEAGTVEYKASKTEESFGVVVSKTYEIPVEAPAVMALAEEEAPIEVKVVIVDTATTPATKTTLTLTGDRTVTADEIDADKIAIVVDGVTTYIDKNATGDDAKVTAANGRYLIDVKNGYSGATTTVSDGKLTVSDTSKGHAYYVAYAVNGLNSDVTGKYGDETVKSYIAKGETIELTFVTADKSYAVKVDGEVVAKYEDVKANDKATVEVTGAVVIEEIQSEKQFKADVADKVSGVVTKTSAGQYALTVAEDGKSATLVIENEGTVSGTGLGTAAKNLLTAGYTIKVGPYTLTEANAIEGGSLKASVVTALAELLPTGDPLVSTDPVTETLTITVSNADGASETYTITITQKLV